MRVKITSTSPLYWYKNAVGKEFDVELTVHPTFKQEEFILLDTYHNQSFFKGTDNEKLSLMMLRDGYMGINCRNAETIK